MNMNKKLGRFKQWAGEKMGGESKTSLSDDFKNMEAEMDLRHQGEFQQSRIESSQGNQTANMRYDSSHRNGQDAHCYEHLHTIGFKKKGARRQGKDVAIG